MERFTRGGVPTGWEAPVESDQKRRGGDPSSGLADPDDDRAAVVPPGVVIPIATCESSARSSSLGASGGSRISVSVPSLAPTTTGTR